MHIKISDAACSYLTRRMTLYAGKQRMPRIVLAAMSCKGAEFRLHFDWKQDDDLELTDRGLRVICEKEIVDRFGGFDLDVERFFFTTRILITPFNDIKQCTCGKQ